MGQALNAVDHIVRRVSSDYRLNSFKMDRKHRLCKMGPQAGVSYDVNQFGQLSGDDTDGEALDLDLSDDDCPLCMSGAHTILKCGLFAKICQQVDGPQTLARAMKILRECQPRQ